ncbi:hypothetical protein [Microvirga rosea]|uniref:hypothetical protein n=1 Tax=Microvirga rosea TaxID=2715425 RepID=UPI001D0AA259|nr:hypothetical protein [Microvirga rosea]MCB8820273.1 hypothetical protein [Microvirga rosea]
MMGCRLVVLVSSVLALAPLPSFARDRTDLPTSMAEASREQVAETLPAPARNALLSARNRKQYVATTVEFAKTAAGKDGILTDADAKGLAPEDPRAVQIRYYLHVPYLKPYFTPGKLGSRSVPRIPVREMGQVAGAIWDKFDANRDGVLSTEENAPLRVARGGSSNGRPPLW